MFSRLKKIASQKPRQLITSCMFGAYTALVVTNVIINRDALSALDLGLLVPAIATLGTAVTQSIIRSIHNVLSRDDNEDENTETTLCIRNSSHNIINSALHITSSSTFIAFDALLLAGITRIPAATPYSAAIVRVTGSSLWCSAAWLNLFTAIARDCKNDNEPDVQHDPFGIQPASFNLTNEILYMMAAICYAYAIYAESPVNPFKAAPNSLWLLAGVIGTSAAIYDCVNERNKNNNDANDLAEVVVERPGF